MNVSGERRVMKKGATKVEADWNTIRTEYFTTDTSYTKLSEKYGVPRGTIADRAAREHWTELREKSQDKIRTKTLRKAESKAADYQTQLYALAIKVASQICEMTDKASMEQLIAAGIKPRDITGAIKDLKDALNIRSEADIREQEARIANLRRQADEAEQSKDITVTIAGQDLSEYSI